MVDVRTRVRWESKTAKKKQEDGRGIKANAVVRGRRTGRVTEAHKKQNKVRGTWIVCRLQIQRVTVGFEKLGELKYTFWILLTDWYLTQVKLSHKKPTVILVFQSSSFLCSSSPFKTFLWQSCINGLSSYCSFDRQYRLTYNNVKYVFVQ